MKIRKIQELNRTKVEDFQSCIEQLQNYINEIDAMFPYGKSIKFVPEELSEFDPLIDEDLDEPISMVENLLGDAEVALELLRELKHEIKSNETEIAYYTKERL